MAYESTNPIKLIAGGPGDTISIYSYKDGDALSAMDAADYFVAEIDRLKVGDVIFAVGNDVAGTLKVLTNDGTNIDTSNSPANVDSD